MQDICNQDVLIYRFLPHGSRKWSDLSSLNLFTTEQKNNSVIAVFHDQEPVTSEWIPINCEWLKCKTDTTESKYKHTIFVHSEKNSQDIDNLDSLNAIPVYHWSHAFIALDWYRYAKVDPLINYDAVPRTKPFLIYNRAWSGTREYRLKFLELLIQSNQHRHCNIKFSVYDNNKHYTKHYFKNKNFKVDCKFENYVEDNTAKSSASADYVLSDYQHSNIEIVLETLFDEKKLHLTEKSLRPIAVGKPFILASSPGSLEYLRSYGFKTFSPWIDESYDLLQDPIERLHAIQKIVEQINAMDQHQQHELFLNCQKTAKYNRERFFSNDFFQLIVNEYVDNMCSAVNQVKTFS